MFVRRGSFFSKYFLIFLVFVYCSVIFKVFLEMENFGKFFVLVVNVKNSELIYLNVMNVIVLLIFGDFIF